MKYATGSMDNQLFVSRYQVELPTVKELQEFIKQDIKIPTKFEEGDNARKPMKPL